jgi:hypothetical protein
MNYNEWLDYLKTEVYIKIETTNYTLKKIIELVINEWIYEMSEQLTYAEIDSLKYELEVIVTNELMYYY